MPQQTNLTIKDGSNVDKTFTAMTPAAGDGGIASWALKEGTIASVFPVLTAMSRKTTNGRALRVKLQVPSSYTDAVTGLTNVGSRAEVNSNYSMPSDFPEAKKDDFVAFAVNAPNTALFKAMIRDALGAN